MPYQSRIDTRPPRLSSRWRAGSAALHHIIAGGIKRKRIFTDDVDSDNLSEEEYSLVLKETKCPDPFRVAALNVYRDIARKKYPRLRLH
jgi:hypothetical protein